MAGLMLIKGYSSGSDDEYDDANPSKTPKNKVNRTNCLPGFSTSREPLEHCAVVFNNPEEHEGRVRSFEHERGIWATLVYVAYTPSEAMESWMISVRDKIPSGNLVLQDFHLSLTRTLVLKFHWVDAFLMGVRDLIRSTPQFTFGITNVKIYCNEERTRTFLGLECQCLDQTLEHYMTSLNKLVTDYGLPPFYEEASFHISFLWLLGDKEEELQELIPSLNESLFKTFSENPDQNYVNVIEIYCKVSKKLYRWPLRR
ncbi:U6 snRNA phosphodiesterase 1 [Diachasmimorpha longicaudata]|uniref:U6 snRNA phosphodiesterase 1 n=1 Tax=Diachasmimorpha longicaudata TaxID=58733 RepID=UPI0030B909FC